MPREEHSKGPHQKAKVRTGLFLKYKVSHHLRGVVVREGNLGEWSGKQLGMKDRDKVNPLYNFTRADC